MNHRLLVSSVVALVAMLWSAQSAAQPDLIHPSLRMVNEFAAPVGLEEPIGDILFSADGNFVYAISLSEDSESNVQSSAVTRDAQGNVVSFGGFSQEFSDAYIDTGLEMAPGSNTLFFRGWDSVADRAAVVQRPLSGVLEYTQFSDENKTYGGLAFVPPKYVNGGQLVTVSYDTSLIHQHSVVDDLDGTFTIGPELLYADFTTTTATETIGDVEFVTRGSMANLLIAAMYSSDAGSAFAIPIDPLTGLPSEGNNPTPEVIIDGLDSVWGIATDPLTENIWLIQYSGSESQLYQLSTEGIFNADFEGEPKKEPPS